VTDCDIRERFEYRAAWLEYVDERDREEAEAEAMRRLTEDEDLDRDRVLTAIDQEAP